MIFFRWTVANFLSEFVSSPIYNADRLTTQSMHKCIIIYFVKIFIICLWLVCCMTQRVPFIAPNGYIMTSLVLCTTNNIRSTNLKRFFTTFKRRYLYFRRMALSVVTSLSSFLFLKFRTVESVPVLFQSHLLFLCAQFVAFSHFIHQILNIVRPVGLCSYIIMAGFVKHFDQCRLESTF